MADVGINTGNRFILHRFFLYILVISRINNNDLYHENRQIKLKFFFFDYFEPVRRDHDKKKVVKGKLHMDLYSLCGVLCVCK